MRTNISTIFIRTAFRQHPDKAQEVLATANEVADHADAFAELDYNIFRGLAFASGNPIYGLILNGMKGLYTRIGRHYFANPEARSLALGFYHKLSALCSEGAHDQVYETVRRYGHESGEIWHRMQKNLPGDLANPSNEGFCCFYRFPILGGQRSSNSTLPSSFCCSSITSNPHRRCTCFSTSLRPRSSGARLCGM